MADYGKRTDGNQKGKGYFGELKRPDGGVSTEISIGVGLNGKEVQIPLIVPTLSKSELNYLLKGDPKSEDFMKNIPDSIIDKAVEYASSRLKQKKSPFAEANEKYSLPEE